MYISTYETLSPFVSHAMFSIQAWELPNVPGEYTGWKRAEVKGPPRPGGRSRGGNTPPPLSEIDFEHFEDHFVAFPDRKIIMQPVFKTTGPCFDVWSLLRRVVLASTCGPLQKLSLVDVLRPSTTITTCNDNFFLSLILSLRHFKNRCTVEIVLCPKSPRIIGNKPENYLRGNVVFTDNMERTDAHRSYNFPCRSTGLQPVSAREREREKCFI